MSQATAVSVAPHTYDQAYPVMIAALVATAAALTGIFSGNTEAESWQLAARYTARTGAAFFLIVFLAGPLSRSPVGPGIEFLSKNRRAWGLAFATAHFIHLAFLTSFFVISGQSPDPLTVAIGGAGYAVLLMMTMTANDASQRVMGHGWTVIHTAGLFYIWFVFAASYGVRLTNPDSIWIGAIGSTLFWSALMVRIIWRKRG
ncbi:MAG: hypothetical protein AAFY01_02230 [Pseudomonadota bacterium]